ncbi:LysM peptidoglycan-binding domain-containing protein [Tissierella praeacuta]|uniref:LysM peptidoglycan-binding domain-containing protein n=1 Tax=Tissierella praeacuta TaxID=43131 RepID=UPI00333E51AE
MEINQTCPTGSTAYIIKAGDTFFAIARTYGISLDALIAANPGVDPNRLFIGQVICVPTAAPVPPISSCPTLNIGSRGSSVAELQQLLRNAGFDPGAIDGIFGTRTQSAVIAFQRSRNLVPDGIVGRLTWTALGVSCTPIATCPAGTFAYTVRAGDTFFILAQRFNTTVDAIQRANPTVNPNSLQIGQIICIP